MSILRKYNTGTNTWDPVVIGAQGNSGTTSVVAPITNSGTANNAILGIATDPNFNGTIGASNLSATTTNGRIGFNISDSFTSNGVTTAHYGMTMNAGGSGVTGVAGWGGVTMYSAGTERMRIDQSGRVTMPYQPAILVDGNNATWNTIAAGNYLTGSYFGLTYARGGMAWDGATGKITVPVAGYYKFTLVVYHAGNTGTRNYFRKNGSDMGFHQVSTASISDGQSTTNWITQAAANDYFQIYVATAGNAYYGSQHSYMIMEFLG